ncbi:Ku protein [Streptomyces sp. NPDC020096]
MFSREIRGLWRGWTSSPACARLVVAAGWGYGRYLVRAHRLWPGQPAHTASPRDTEARPHLHEVHVGCGSRVRHRRVCEREGRELAQEEIARGWQAPDGRVVVLRDVDLDDLPLPTRKQIKVLGFVPDDDIDPIMYGRSYYASPNGSAADRPYALLVEALAGAGRIAVCKLAIRTRERLAVLRPRQGILVCHTLHWPQEIRQPGDWAPSAPVTDQELRLAEVLMEQLAGVDVDDLHDEYAAALKQLITAKPRGASCRRCPSLHPRRTYRPRWRRALSGRGDVERGQVPGIVS